MNEQRSTGLVEGRLVRLALCFALALQMGACSYRFGDDFYAAPFFCLATGTDGVLSLAATSYGIGLLLNPVVMLVGLANRRVAPFALVFALTMLAGNIGQIWLLDAGKIFCDGP